MRGGGRAEGTAVTENVAPPRSGAEHAIRSSGQQGSRPGPAPRRACASCPSRSGMLLPLLRRSCFPSSSPGGGGGGSGAERVEGARGPGARGRRPEREPYACMDPSAALHRRPAGGGLGAVSPALSGGQARRRKQPPRPADFKLQVIIIGSRGVGKTSLMERFTDDTFCEACKSTVGTPGLGRVGLRGGRGPGPVEALTTTSPPGDRLLSVAILRVSPALPPWERLTCEPRTGRVPVEALTPLPGPGRVFRGLSAGVRPQSRDIPPDPSRVMSSE